MKPPYDYRPNIFTTILGWMVVGVALYRMVQWLLNFLP